MLPRPTADPMAAKMKALRPEKAPRFAAEEVAALADVVLLMSSPFHHVGRVKLPLKLIPYCRAVPGFQAMTFGICPRLRSKNIDCLARALVLRRRASSMTADFLILRCVSKLPHVEFRRRAPTGTANFLELGIEPVGSCARSSSSSENLRNNLAMWD